MSDFVIYVHLEPFLKQWLLHSFQEPVSFPAQSVANATIRHFVTRQPADKPVPLKEDGDVAIRIPDSKYKKPSIFNYLTQYGHAALREHINDLFNLDLWANLSDVATNNLHIMNSIYQYCDDHNIDIEYANTIRQRFYRMRKSYEKHGIRLEKKTKKKGY